MTSRVRRLFANIAATSLALGASSPAAADELAAIPEDTLSDVIEEAERGPATAEERLLVIQRIAADSRPFVRAQAAAAAGSLFPEGGETTLALLRRLAADDSDVVRNAAASGLARALERASPVERIQMVCDWALSAQNGARAAIARALVSPTPVFVADIALECLSSDADAEVRLAALLAVAAHFDEAPALYGAITERLATDSDRHVRRAARNLVSMKSRC